MEGEMIVDECGRGWVEIKIKLFIMKVLRINYIDMFKYWLIGWLFDSDLLIDNNGL